MKLTPEQIDDKIATIAEVIGKGNIMPHLKGKCYFSKEVIEMGSNKNDMDKSVCRLFEPEPLVKGFMIEYHQSCYKHFLKLADKEQAKQEKALNELRHGVEARLLDLPAMWDDFHEFPTGKPGDKDVEYHLKNQADKWLKDDELGLFISGAAGILKTFTAVYIARLWLKKHPGKKALFCGWGDYQIRLSQTYGNAATRTAYGQAKPLIETPLLIIDDVLGRADISGAQYSLIKEVIDARRRNSSKKGPRFYTIITTNYDPDDITEMEQRANLESIPLADRLTDYTLVALGNMLPSRRGAQ